MRVIRRENDTFYGPFSVRVDFDPNSAEAPARAVVLDHKEDPVVEFLPSLEDIVSGRAVHAVWEKASALAAGDDFELHLPPPPVPEQNVARVSPGLAIFLTTLCTLFGLGAYFISRFILSRRVEVGMDGDNVLLLLVAICLSSATIGTGQYLIRYLRDPSI